MSVLFISFNIPLDSFAEDTHFAPSTLLGSTGRADYWAVSGDIRIYKKDATSMVLSRGGKELDTYSIGSIIELYDRWDFGGNVPAKHTITIDDNVGDVNLCFGAEIGGYCYSLELESSEPMLRVGKGNNVHIRMIDETIFTSTAGADGCSIYSESPITIEYDVDDDNDGEKDYDCTNDLLELDGCNNSIKSTSDVTLKNVDASIFNINCKNLSIIDSNFYAAMDAQKNSTLGNFNCSQNINVNNSTVSVSSITCHDLTLSESPLSVEKDIACHDLTLSDGSLSVNSAISCNNLSAKGGSLDVKKGVLSAGNITFSHTSSVSVKNEIGTGIKCDGNFAYKGSSLLVDAKTSGIDANGEVSLAGEYSRIYGNDSYSIDCASLDITQLLEFELFGAKKLVNLKNGNSSIKSGCVNHRTYKAGASIDSLIRLYLNSEDDIINLLIGNIAMSDGTPYRCFACYV